MKLSVIGGGGVRSLFLARSLSQRAEELQINEVVFMDNNEEKLRIFGGIARHAAGLICPALRFTLTTDAVEAIRDSDYVITTIRAGGDEKRRIDEHIALDLGVLGQETTGAAGFAFAMRSVPALLEYCEMVRKYAKPNAKMFNFTNPVGIVSQALNDAGYDFTYGICDSPSSMLRDFAKLYGKDPREVTGEMFGLNHLSWLYTVDIDGKNVVPDLLKSPEARKESDLHFFSPEILEFANAVPNEYLYYYYSPEKAYANIMKTGITRGDDIYEINKGMIEELRSLDPDQDFDQCLRIFSKWYGMRENKYMTTETGLKHDKEWKMNLFEPDNGGYAGVALRYISLRQSGKSGKMILCVKNNGAVDWLGDGDTVEVTCDIDQSGAVTPHHFDAIPEAQKELIRRVKYYERCGAKAILNRDRKLAVESLALHPLINSFTLAEQLVDKFLKASPEFDGDWN